MNVSESTHIFAFFKWHYLITAFILCGCMGDLYAIPDKQRVNIEKYIYDGAYRKALVEIDDIMPIYSDDPEIYMLKGICFYNLNKQKKEAIGVLEKGLALSKDDNTKCNILLHLGKAYAVNKDYYNAVATYYTLEKEVADSFIDFHEEADRLITEWLAILDKEGITPPQKETDKKIRKSTAENFSQATPNTPQLAKLHVPTPEIPQKADKEYTIQICTLNAPLTDSFLKGNNAIKVIRTGELYRYIYSRYNSLQAARADLPKVRKIYPEAFIREIEDQKLGQAIDLNINNVK